MKHRFGYFKYPPYLNKNPLHKVNADMLSFFQEEGLVRKAIIYDCIVDPRSLF